MNPPSKRTSGFTLIELMITVAIVAVLGAVAYPSYIGYIVRSNRAAAQSYLMEMSGLQQRYLLDARQYGAASAIGVSAPGNLSSIYSFTTTPASGPPPSFTVTATPLGKQLARDTKCGTMTLDQAGTKTASGSGGVAGCW
jgi:type IV pilus assembly protein PilE